MIKFDIYWEVYPSTHTARPPMTSIPSLPRQNLRQKRGPAWLWPGGDLRRTLLHFGGRGPKTRCDIFPSSLSHNFSYLYRMYSAHSTVIFKFALDFISRWMFRQDSGFARSVFLSFPLPLICASCEFACPWVFLNRVKLPRLCFKACCSQAEWQGKGCLSIPFVLVFKLPCTSSSSSSSPHFSSCFLSQNFPSIPSSCSYRCSDSCNRWPQESSFA